MALKFCASEVRDRERWSDSRSWCDYMRISTPAQSKKKSEGRSKEASFRPPNLLKVIMCTRLTFWGRTHASYTNIRNIIYIFPLPSEQDGRPVLKGLREWGAILVITGYHSHVGCIWWQTPRSGSLNVGGGRGESINQWRFIDPGQCSSQDWSASRAISHSALITRRPSVRQLALAHGAPAR